MWSVQPTRVDPFGLIFKNYLNTCNWNFMNHWWILLLNLLVLTCESDSCILQFLNELNLTYRRLTGFMTSFYFIPIVLVPWGKFSLCHTPIRPISALRDQISILIVGCVTTSRDSHHKLKALKKHEGADVGMQPLRKSPIQVLIGADVFDLKVSHVWAYFF
jgi:hypothetical protein